jgi:hypothetical protein
MSRYTVFIKEQAQQDLKALSKSEPKAYKKALKLIAELYDHPQTGTGKPEQLKGLAEHHGAEGSLRSTASSMISLKMSSKLSCFLPTDITATSNLLRV